MDKLKLNYAVDLGLIVTFLLTGVTGIIKFPGLLANLGVKVKELPWRQISQIHDWAGMVMVVLVAVHIALNFKWLVAMTKKYFGKKR